MTSSVFSILSEWQPGPPFCHALARQVWTFTRCSGSGSADVKMLAASIWIWVRNDLLKIPGGQSFHRCCGPVNNFFRIRGAAMLTSGSGFRRLINYGSGSMKKNVLSSTGSNLWKIIKYWIFSQIFFKYLINIKDPDPYFRIYGFGIINYGSGSVALLSAQYW